jgi:hypothetical protein
MFGSGRAVTRRVAIGMSVRAVAGGSFATNRAGTNVVTHSSNVVVSLAMSGESGKAAGSSAGTRSMTVRRVSTLVPWRA